MLKLLDRFLRRRRQAVRAALPPLPTIAEPAPEDERPLGCGWFDSSHELERGLVVREADDEALGPLPLPDWLSLHLRDWQPDAARWCENPAV